MEAYLFASNGTYLAVGKGDHPQMIASSEVAAFNSLISIESYQTNGRGLHVDCTLRSESLVTMRTCDGRMLAPDAYGMLHPNGATTGQLGYNVYQIIKVDGYAGDPIEPGDTIALRLYNPEPAGQSPWMTLNMTGSEAAAPVIFQCGKPEPSTYERFRVYQPVDLQSFMIEYDDLYNEVVVAVALTDRPLPGGHVVRLESPNAPELFPTIDLTVGTEPYYVIRLPEEAQHLTAATKRKIAVRASFMNTGTMLEQPLILEGDRAYFMRMEVQKTHKVAADNKKAASYEVEVLLEMDAQDRRMIGGELPLAVELFCKDRSVVQNLTQDGTQLTYDHPITVRFTVDQPPRDAEPLAGVIWARYRLNGQDRVSSFMVKVSHKGILVDPR